MKKILILLAIMLNVVLLAQNTDNEVPTSKFKNIAVFKDKNFELIKAKKLESGDFLIHGIAKGRDKFVGIDILVTSDLKYISVGRTIDAKSNRQIQLKLNNDDLEKIKKFKNKYKLSSFNEIAKKAIVTYGTGEKKYLLFTDPDCPFCKRFEKKIIKNGLKNDVTLYIFPMHLNLRGHNLKSVEYLISLPENKRREAMEKLMTGDKTEYLAFKSTKHSKQIVKKWVKYVDTISRSLKVRGTPTVIDEYGVHIKNFSDLFKSKVK